MNTIDLTYQVSDNQIFKLDMTSTPNIEYYGYTLPGRQDTDSDWKIFILNLDGNGVPISKQFANASPAYKFQWSQRTTYAFS